MKFILKAACSVAIFCRGSYVGTFYTVFGIYFLFNLLEAGVEIMFFGEPFYHRLDNFFGAAFIAFLILCLGACGSYNRANHHKR